MKSVYSPQLKGKIILVQALGQHFISMVFNLDLHPKGSVDPVPEQVQSFWGRPPLKSTLPSCLPNF